MLTSISFVFPLFHSLIEEYQTYILTVFISLSFAILYLEKKIKIYTLLLCFLTISLLAVFYLKRGYSAGNFAMPIILLLIIFLFSKMNFKKNDLKVVFLFLRIVYFSMVYQSISYAIGFWSRNDSYNQNTLAIMLFFPTAFFAVYNPFRNRILRHIFVVSCFAITLLLVFLLECRAVLVCTFVFITLYLMKLLHKHSFLVALFVVSIIVLGYALVSYSNRIEEFESISLLNSFGKTLLSGRDYIWNTQMEHLKENTANLLFGSGWMSDYEIENNFHSAFVLILVRHGLVGAIFFWLVLCVLLFKSTIAFKNNKDNVLWGFFCMFIVLILYGFFETSFLWNMFMPLAVFPLLYLTNYRKRIENKLCSI